MGMAPALDPELNSFQGLQDFMGDGDGDDTGYDEATGDYASYDGGKGIADGGKGYDGGKGDGGTGSANGYD
eukprot:6286588-Pyramimonas_sp.AAC.1